MAALLYVRLIGYTAGTLLMLFWMVVILGYRRQRNFERVFFFLCLALFFFYGGSLLALNAEIHYPAPPALLEAISRTLVVTGLWVLPALLLHLNVEYAAARGSLGSRGYRIAWVAAAYIPLLLLIVVAYANREAAGPFEFTMPVSSFSAGYRVWLLAAIVASALWQRHFQKTTNQAAEKRFHVSSELWLGIAAFLVLDLHVHAVLPGLSRADALYLSASLTFLPLISLGELIYAARKHNFLQIGRQRNLVYAVSITFLALLYLSATRRVGEWLEPVFPPEATAAVLVFILVALFEPLQRVVGRMLKATAQSEFDRSSRIITAVREVARLGDLEGLRRFTEKWLREQLELGEVQLMLGDGAEHQASQGENDFVLRQAGHQLGVLHVRPHGAMLSGETRAALEFLCEQLPGALDVCRLIEEKLRLERELAERERMAALGQMAASISHNLKNPLGSIKTILQVQLESPELPETLRGETRLMLEEISRLSAKLNQLLQFSRPMAVAEKNDAGCETSTVIEEVVRILRRGAEERGLTLEVIPAPWPVRVKTNSETVSDIASNLVVNALDAAQRGGRVRVQVAKRNGECLVSVEDDGPGIAEDVREKILQPFFTTKAQGTGLGLAIVARRVAEAGGRIEIESPAKDGRGARFTVVLPLEQEKA